MRARHLDIIARIEEREADLAKQGVFEAWPKEEVWVGYGTYEERLLPRYLSLARWYDEVAS